jgi:hypothetical protein
MMMMNQNGMMKSLALACVLLVSAGAWANEVYKWVDKDGKVHYSDEPVAAPEAKKLKRNTGNPATGAPAKGERGAAAASDKKTPRTTADKELESRRRKVEAEETEKKEQVAQTRAKEKAAYCGSLKGNLKALEQGGRISKHDEKGEQIFLDDAMREKELAQVKLDIQKNCE